MYQNNKQEPRKLFRRGGSAINNLTVIRNDQAVTSSRLVAAHFEKDHNELKKKIRELEKDMGESSHIYFQENEYIDTMNRVQLEYLMNRDGFSLLAMGFTGQKALTFKMDFIQAFNHMETELNSPERIMARALRIADETINKLSLFTKQQEQVIGELKPKADYTDNILKNTGLVTITQIAKDYGMSGAAMNELLHELGVQFKQSEQWLLYVKYHGKGYTHSETVPITRTDGRKDVKMNTKWTQKGRLFLYNLLKENEIYPVIEIKEAI